MKIEKKRGRKEEKIKKIKNMRRNGFIENFPKDLLINGVSPNRITGHLTNISCLSKFLLLVFSI